MTEEPQTTFDRYIGMEWPSDRGAPLQPDRRRQRGLRTAVTGEGGKLLAEVTTTHVPG